MGNNITDETCPLQGDGQLQALMSLAQVLFEAQNLVEFGRGLQGDLSWVVSLPTTPCIPAQQSPREVSITNYYKIATSQTLSVDKGLHAIGPHTRSPTLAPDSSSHFVHHKHSVLPVKTN